jgi:hypothetical protein
LVFFLGVLSASVAARDFRFAPVVAALGVAFDREARGLATVLAAALVALVAFPFALAAGFFLEGFVSSGGGVKLAERSRSLSPPSPSDRLEVEESGDGGEGDVLAVVPAVNTGA